MDKEIFERYQKTLLPFDGIVLRAVTENSFIPLEKLTKIIKLIFEFLHDNSLLNRIYKCADWLEHDGYLPCKKEIPVEFVWEFVKDEEAFYKNRNGDTWVNWGFYDGKSRWYLRVYIVDEYDIDEEQEKCGRFDITLDSKFAMELKNSIENKISIEINICKPKEYFDKIRV